MPKCSYQSHNDYANVVTGFLKQTLDNGQFGQSDMHSTFLPYRSARKEIKLMYHYKEKLRSYFPNTYTVHIRLLSVFFDWIKIESLLDWFSALIIWLFPLWSRQAIWKRVHLCIMYMHFRPPSPNGLFLVLKISRNFLISFASIKVKNVNKNHKIDINLNNFFKKCTY